MMFRTTPGEMSRCRGTAVVCCPHGQPHLVWLPSSLTFVQSLDWSARSTRRRLISLTTSLESTGSRCHGKGGIDLLGQVLGEARRAGEGLHR
jgi:hypothetical protein